MSRVKTTIREQLAAGKTVTTFTTGTSMEPLLYEGQTWVTIVPVSGPLAVGELPIFLREDGVYLIHRIVAKRGKFYFTRGDNCIYGEKICREQILGKVTEIWRNGKCIRVTDPGYLRYVRIWNASFPVRRILMRLRERYWRLKRRAKRLLCGPVEYGKRLLRGPVEYGRRLLRGPAEYGKRLLRGPAECGKRLLRRLAGHEGTEG